jgi:hypothetical protein
MLNLNLAIFNGLDGTGSWLGGGRGWPAVVLCGLNFVFLGVCLRQARRLPLPTGSSRTAAAAS